MTVEVALPPILSVATVSLEAAPLAPMYSSVPPLTRDGRVVADAVGQVLGRIVVDPQRGAGIDGERRTN